MLIEIIIIDIISHSIFNVPTRAFPCQTLCGTYRLVLIDNCTGKSVLSSFYSIFFSVLRDKNDSQKTAKKEWRLKFQRSPVELLCSEDGKSVSGVRFEVNELVEVK